MHLAPIAITDPADPRLDDIRDLNSSDSRPDLPGGKGLVIAEGSLVVPRLLSSGYPVRSVVGFEGKLSVLQDVTCSAAQLAGGPVVYQVSREVLREVAGFDMHRGLVAAADRIPERTVPEVLADIPAGPSVIAILEGVGDHENIGALFRNAAGLGVDAVLFGAATADPLYRRAVRVSMGHVLRVPWARFSGKTTNWQHGLDAVREAGFQIIAMTPDTELSLADAVLAVRREQGEGARIAIMVGAEGPGLTEHAMRAADVRAKIPMMPGTDSLNVATAAAIGFYASRY